MSLVAFALALASAQELPAGPDRSQPPEVVPPEPIELVEPVTVELRPGITLHHVRVPGVRLVDIRVIPRRGIVDLEQRESMLGQAMGALADVAVGELSSDELSITEDLYDLDLWSTAGLHDGTLGVEVPTADLPRAIELLDDLLHTPTYPKREIAQWVRNRGLDYAIRWPTSQRMVAARALRFAWWPETTPWGETPDLEALTALKKPAPLVGLHTRWLAESPLDILVVGDVGLDEVQEALARITADVGAARERGAEPVLPPLKGLTVVGVDMPQQQQVAVRLRTGAPAILDDGRVLARITAHALGGHFLSRLNRNLREEKGWTYGAYAGWQGELHWGAFTVAVDVPADLALSAVAEIEAELERVVDEGISAEELDTSRRLLVQSWNETRATADDAANRYAAALDEQRSLAEIRADYEALATVTPEQVRAFAAEWLSTERVAADRGRIWVLVGSRDALEPQLAQRGWTAAWIEPDDAIMGTFDRAPRASSD